jgi:fatty acid desaturase
MLKYKADRRTLAFVSTYFLLVTALWVWDPAPSFAAPLVAVTAMLSWICAVITHNTLHQPMFRSQPLNKVMQVVLTLSYGWPVSEYIPGHNKSHHRFVQGRQDVMRTTKVQYRWNWLNFLMFVPRVAVDVTAGNMEYMRVMRKKRPRWFRQFVIETTFCWGVKLVALAVDWRKALLYLFLPHLFAVWGITAVNFLQHDGTEAGNVVNGSRNFVGRIFNWFTFNNGFHGIHHLKPSLHWSLLPEAHARLVHPTIHPALEQRSLALYVFRTFVWPGKRARYDGKPLLLPEEGPDQKWFGIDGDLSRPTVS